MEELTCLEGFVPFEPRIFAVIETGEGVGNYFERLGFFTDTDYVTGFYGVRGDVDNLAVDNDVTVKHELTGCCTGGCDTETVNDVVETAFEKLEKDFTGDTLGAGCFLKEVVELFFENAVGVFGLLFLAELHTVFRGLATLVLTVLARRVIFLGKDFVFAEDGFAKFAGDSGSGTCVSSHF